MLNPDKLLASRPSLDALRAEYQVVEDVLAGPAALKNLQPGRQGRAECPYLPRNRNEHPDEYATRLALTPVFSETSAVLQARLGALFRKAPTLTLPPALSTLETQATLRGAALADVAAQVAQLVQRQGFCGVLLDRAPLPEDAKGRTVSRDEARRRGLGRVVLAPCAASQILDWGEDAQGLAWVKLLENFDDAPAWDSAPERRAVVRVADREALRVYEIRESASGPSVRAFPAVPHGARDAHGRPCVPFVFFHPFPGRDGLGRSVLRPVAEADLAATRILSELMWMLHMMTPLLALTTSREEQDLGEIGLGASRFLVLRAARHAEPAENLSFVQLDPTAADRLAQMYERMIAKAREQALRTGAAVAGPVEQSGISKAWSFKTGEERLLFLLGRELQTGFQKILDLAERMSGLPAGRAAIVFPDAYDVDSPDAPVALAERVLPIFERYGLTSASASILERLYENLAVNPSGVRWTEFQNQLARVRTRKSKVSM